MFTSQKSTYRVFTVTQMGLSHTITLRRKITTVATLNVNLASPLPTHSKRNSVKQTDLMKVIVCCRVVEGFPLALAQGEVPVRTCKLI